jgi:hypothetical protein
MDYTSNIGILFYVKVFQKILKVTEIRGTSVLFSYLHAVFELKIKYYAAPGPHRCTGRIES